MELTIHWGHGVSDGRDMISDASSSEPVTSWITTNELANLLFVTALKNTISCESPEARSHFLKLSEEARTQKQIILRYNPETKMVYLKSTTNPLSKGRSWTKADDLPDKELKKVISDLLAAVMHPNSEDLNEDQYKALLFYAISLPLKDSDELQFMNGITLTKRTLLLKSMFYTYENPLFLAKEALAELLQPGEEIKTMTGKRLSKEELMTGQPPTQETITLRAARRFLK